MMEICLNSNVFVGEQVVPLRPLKFAVYLHSSIMIFQIWHGTQVYLKCKTS